MPMWGRVWKHHCCLAHSVLHHGVLEAQTLGHSKASLGYVQVVTHCYGLLPSFRALWISGKGFNGSPPPPPFPSSSIDENETTMFTCLEVFKANDPFLQIEKSCFGTCQLDVAVRDSLTLFKPFIMVRKFGKQFSLFLFFLLLCSSMYLCEISVLFSTFSVQRSDLFLWTRVLSSLTCTIPLSLLIIVSHVLAQQFHWHNYESYYWCLLGLFI